MRFKNAQQQYDLGLTSVSKCRDKEARGATCDPAEPGSTAAIVMRNDGVGEEARGICGSP